MRVRGLVKFARMVNGGQQAARGDGWVAAASEDESFVVGRDCIGCHKMFVHV